MAASQEHQLKADPRLAALGRVAAGVALFVALATVATSQPPDNGGELNGRTGEPASVARPRRGYGHPAQAPTDGAQLGAAGDMIGFSRCDGSGTQTITLVHTGKAWMAVYHIDRSGAIRLVSSRPIDADFSLQLNATSPLPTEIRKIGRR